MATSGINTKRIIALVDMDCFYVQVVQRKNPSLKGKPCAVVQYNQWQGGGIIAVGYEAREHGVTRQMRGKQAKEKCPSIQLVSVPESRGKADLTLFREAGAEVIEVLAEFADCLERASVDEAYMDLTNTIDQLVIMWSLTGNGCYSKTLTLKFRSLDNYKVEDVALRTFSTTHIVGYENMELKLQQEEIIKQCDLYKEWLNVLKSDENFYRLAVGAVIADNMRNAVKEKTGFSCSAGVGPNKMLAKVVAGFHKPNQQTLVLPQHVSEMFKTTKIKKIRSLGGKVGAQLVEKLKVEFMSDLLTFSLSDLRVQVGAKNSELVYGLCRGVDHEPVRPRQLPKSVGCSKNFRGFQKLKSKADVKKWLGNLCEEIVERLEKEKVQNNRVATLFTVGCLNDLNQSQSRRCNVLHGNLQELLDETFKSLSEFNRSKTANDWTPAITNLNLNASKFQSQSVSGTKSINTYMSTTATTDNRENNSNTISTTVGNTNQKNTSPQKEAGISKFFPIVDKNEANSLLSQVVKPLETSSSINSKKTETFHRPSCIDYYSTLSKSAVNESSRIELSKITGNGNKNENSPVSTRRRFNVVSTSPDVESTLKQRRVLTGNTFQKQNFVDYYDRKQSNDEEKTLITKSQQQQALKSCSENEEKSEDPLPFSYDMNSNNKQRQEKSACSSLFSRFCKATSGKKLKEERFDQSIDHTDSEDPLDVIKNKPTSLQQSNSETSSLHKKHTSSNVNRTLSPRRRDTSLNVNRTLTSSSSSSSLSCKNNNLDDLVHCDKCEKRILVWDLPEHLDFHYAKEVQDSLKEKFVNLYNHTNNSSSSLNSKRKASSDGSAPLNGSSKKRYKTEANSLGKYFSPVKK